MKNQFNGAIHQHHDEIEKLAKELFETPELGYKEVKTKKIIQQFLKDHGFIIEKEYFNTGFQVTIGNACKPHIGLIAELDAIPTPNHPCEDQDTHAAHSCGHSTQCAMMIATLMALRELFDQNQLQGKVTLFFTPAEEFIDLDYRDELMKENKISAYGGKQNMLLAHHFDEVDCFLHAHGMGEYRGYAFNVQSSLAGFIYKKYNFIGKASHAAMAPSEGINALNACTLFMQAQAMLRETFKDEDMNRIHGIITKGGDVVNSIPAEVTYESYIRSFSSKTLQSLNEQCNRAAKHTALALGATCEIEEIKGYLPFTQDRNLSKVVYDNMLAFTTADQVQTDEKSIASGDIGDLGHFKPAIQFGYTGFKGTMHGKNLLVDDEELVYQTTAKILGGTVIDLLTHPNTLNAILENFKPTMTLEEYRKYLSIKD